MRTELGASPGALKTRSIGDGRLLSPSGSETPVIDRPLALASQPSLPEDLSDADPRPPRRSRVLRWLGSESGVITLIAFAIYLTIAILLDFKYRILPLDA